MGEAYVAENKKDAVEDPVCCKARRSAQKLPLPALGNVRVTARVGRFSLSRTRFKPAGKGADRGKLDGDPAVGLLRLSYPADLEAMAG